MGWSFCAGQGVSNLLKTLAFARVALRRSGRGGICGSWRRLLLVRVGAARVPGREEAAALCGGRYLAANMDYYDIRVNVALWLGLWRAAFEEQQGFCSGYPLVPRSERTRLRLQMVQLI